MSATEDQHEGPPSDAESGAQEVPAAPSGLGPSPALGSGQPPESEEPARSSGSSVASERFTPPPAPEGAETADEAPDDASERRSYREALLSFLNDKGAIVWPLPKGPEPPEGSRLARGWRSLVQGSERVSWHAAAVVWAFFVGSWGALMVYRAFMRSSLARLLESKDVPFLAYMDDWFWAYAWGCVTLGGLATALAGGHWWDERGSRRRQVMFGGSLLATLVAGWTLRYSTSAEGALSVSNTGLSDWVLLALFGIVCWVGSACRAEEGRRELLPRSPSPAGQAWAYDAPLFYCLSVVAIAALAIDEHRILWDYARNGKFNYVRFFAEGELALANQVLYSTSLLFASLAAGLALLFQLAFRLAGSRGAEDRWPALRRRCLLASLGLSVVAMVPWMVKVGREIVGEGNYFFPVGVVGCLWACLFPLLAATAALLERDLDEDCVGLSRWGEAGRLLFVTLTFPVYPFLRLVRFRTLRSWTCVLYGFTALALLVMLVRLGYTMNAWWEFEDWRGMMKSGQFPATRVAVSLFAAGAVFVALGGVRRRLGKWLGLPFLVLGFGLLAFASWPLWGWSEIPRNVHTRCVEFSSRHKFERRFLTWLLDFDRDGYAALLAGGDPDDFDPEIQGTGLPPLREVAMPLDTFRIETPAQAARFPSVVLLTLEGVTPASITAYGLRPGLGGKVATPAMDALAREGALFTRAYAAYPSTWDGWFMLHSGRTLSVQEFDSSQPFGDRYTRYGNLHHLMREVGIRRFCYPDTRPYTDLFVPARDEDLLFEPEFSASRTKEERKAGVTKGDKRIDRVVRFIESIGEGERFFVTEHMGDTHFPWADVTAARAKELGYPKGMSWVAMDASVDGVSVPRLGRYYQQITRMDTQVGRVVEALRAKGVLDQTLIVIVSDHGCQWYEHEHAYYVSHLYEQSLRIPWIVRGPGVEAGIVSDLPIAQIDLLPTLVEMSGARLEQPERPLEGQSLLPIWKGSPEDDAFRDRYWKRTLLLKTHYDTVGVLVNFRHKLIVDRPTGIRWLFDLEADPGELINLIDREPELEARLEQVLRAEVETRMPFLGGLKRSGER